MLRRTSALIALALALLLSALSTSSLLAKQTPNIVYILADDLGYGDLQCFNPAGKIPTPHINQLAAEGMRFTDAHSSSSVCTPTRYGILTGRYNWRSRLQKGVLYGYSQRLIETNRLTVAAFLQSHGYKTACIGKWHLGMNWSLKNGGTAVDAETMWNVDYTKPIQHGPNAVGFDHFFGISASLDMPPYVYIENDRVIGNPTVEKKWIRKGPATEEFEAIDVLPRIAEEASRFIKTNAKHPFFLYVPLTAPHTPILPTKEWQNKSDLNAYGDFVMQVDATVGTIMNALQATEIEQNTLLIFTSDNGCSPQARFKPLADKGHHPSYHFRGHKADIFEGGHRIPFIARWPSQIATNAENSQTICLTDLMATCADILGETLPDDAAEDSVSILPALTSTSTKPVREAIVHHSINGTFAIRQGDWKLILGPDSGGWSSPRPGKKKVQTLPNLQLYNFNADIGERNNLQFEHPEIVVPLVKLLEKYVSDGRSTPGEPQPNDGTIDIWTGAPHR